MPGGGCCWQLSPRARRTSEDESVGLGWVEPGSWGQSPCQGQTPGIKPVGQLALVGKEFVSSMNESGLCSGTGSPLAGKHLPLFHSHLPT